MLIFQYKHELEGYSLTGAENDTSIHESYLDQPASLSRKTRRYVVIKNKIRVLIRFSSK